MACEILAVRVLRYQCPHCLRTWAKKAAAGRHAARCFKSQAARGCKTCALWQPKEKGDGTPYGYPGTPESCGAGEDLSGRLKFDCPKWEAIF